MEKGAEMGLNCLRVGCLRDEFGLKVDLVLVLTSLLGTETVVETEQLEKSYRPLYGLWIQTNPKN